jgi:polysaccharide biosynthesis/export protein
MTMFKRCIFILALVSSTLAGQLIPSVAPQTADAAEYMLGPDDQIKIWALGAEEISDKPVRIGPSGDIDLPLIGRVHAAGLTVEQFKSVLKQRLTKEVREPQVSVDIVEYGSQPASVMGAVNHPGVYQLSGRKTLAEVLSVAGGLRPDAGPYVKIARQMKWGAVPLPNAHNDPSGDFSVAQEPVKTLLSATNPAENILIRPHDVITVPTAEMVYVVGAVKKPGAFTLNERESVSVLQALSMAEGLGSTPKPQDSKILRTVPGASERKEIPVDLKKVMTGKAEDQALRANDILFVPDSTSKKAATRALEAIIQTATGVVIWRGPRP